MSSLLKAQRKAPPQAVGLFCWCAVMFIRSALPRSRLALLRQEGRELNALVVHAAPVDVVKQEANDVFFSCQGGERQTEIHTRL